MTFTFECCDPISLCLRLLRHPEGYTSSLGAAPPFDIIHTFELIDAISPPDLILTANLLLKNKHYLFANAVDYRQITPTVEMYVGAIFGIHPQIFPVVYGVRCVGAEATFSDCTTPRNTVWDPSRRDQSLDIQTVVFQRIIATPYRIEGLGEMSYTPTMFVSSIHATAYNFPTNRFSHMMNMETVVTGLLAFIQQMDDSVPVHKWQFWEPFTRLVRGESALMSHRAHLQASAFLHGVHLHLIVNERDCPLCRGRPLSSYLSLYTIKVKDPVMAPNTSVGIFVNKGSKFVTSFLENVKDTHVAHGVSLRRGSDEHCYLDLYFPRKLADDSMKVSVVKFTERELGGRKVQMPSLLYGGILRDNMVSGSRYSFRSPHRQRTTRSAFGRLRANVPDCEKIQTVIDVSRELMLKVDCHNLKVDRDEKTQMRLSLRCKYAQFDVLYPYPIYYPEMKIEFHCGLNVATIVAPRDQHCFYNQSPMFILTPTNRLFLPAFPVGPPSSITRDFLPLQLSSLEKETIKRLPARWLTPVVRLKRILQLLFHLVPITRFFDILTVGEFQTEPRQVGMIVVHDEVIDLGTRSPAIDLSYCFVKEGRDQEKLATAWAKITGESLPHSISVGAENLDFFKKMLTYFSMRTHVVFSENNHTSFCRVKLLRRHGVDELFTRAVVFPVYPAVEATPSKHLSSDCMSDKEDECMTKPQFLAGVCSPGGVIISEDIQRIMDELSPTLASKTIKPTVVGGDRNWTSSGYPECESIDGLAQLLCQSSSTGTSSFFQVLANLKSTRNLTSGPKKKDEEEEERESEKKKETDSGVLGATAAPVAAKGTLAAEDTSETSAKSRSKKKKRKTAGEAKKGETVKDGEAEVKKLSDNPAPSIPLREKNTTQIAERDKDMVKAKSDEKVHDKEREKGRVNVSESKPLKDETNSGTEGGVAKPEHRGREGGRSKGKCTNCGQSSDHMKKCAGCGKPRYCSRECQKQHWKLHKPECLSGERTRQEKRDRVDLPSGKEEETAPLPSSCSGCGKTSASLKRCKCLGAAYCNVFCQRMNWPQHKLTCSAAPSVKVSAAL